MKKFGDDYETDVSIDKQSLESECEVQPSVFYYYADQLADAKSNLETVRNALEATKARRELHWRRNPPLDIKATESVYTAMLEDDKEVQDAKDAVQVANTKVGVLYAAVNALEQRKGCLDNLVRLSVTNYYNSSDVSDISRDRLNGGK